MSPRLSDEERVAFLALDGRSSGDDDFDEYIVKTNNKHERLPLPGRLRSWLCSRPRILRRNVLRNPLVTILVAVKYIILSLAFVLIATPILIPSYTRLPPHYREREAACKGPDAAPGCANPFQEKIFISVSLYDKGGHLASGRWGEQVLELIQMLGPENTFLSIYENDSPLGETALEDFKQRVPCNHEIVFDRDVSLSEFDNVTLPDGTERMKRLSYLSEVRNRALRPLDRFRTDTGVVRFDKVLFLNDVLFRTVDATQLLFSTNTGEDGRAHYLSACALDYENPFKFYDLYAQRDAEGYSNGVPIFPIFSTAGNGYSREDMIMQRDAVRVSGCWSGMVAMQAKYVQNLRADLPTPTFQDIGAHVVDPARPTPIEAPVRFRYEPEIFFDACECCLFLADVSTAAKKDNAAEQGTFVNPYVRVAYEDSVLTWLHRVKRWERLFIIPHRVVSWLAGLPRNNPYREVQEGQPFVEEVWQEDHWELVNRTGRSGMFCAVREMQLIIQEARTGDKNWMNWPMPPGQQLDFPT
ncbi:family 69 glycosyltransferase [Cryphonectria parasitica EP155]|uniref:Family 69 glycosyltransferase n=1 Tax=Cryphonectria parasitica (strain ATCC 38755 / EP155) TaxID=660469 RepID=A0A9P4XVH9_CRYP1|nr:family 69 glycosyltransferase [Cryphonectria parasitica EP155]KAF3762052.1 family 69 glycosyltransferase [Cryphonectria parasitica EP155]